MNGRRINTTSLVMIIGSPLPLLWLTILLIFNIVG